MYIKQKLLKLFGEIKLVFCHRWLSLICFFYIRAHLLIKVWLHPVQWCLHFFNSISKQNKNKHFNKATSSYQSLDHPDHMTRKWIHLKATFTELNLKDKFPVPHLIICHTVEVMNSANWRRPAQVCTRKSMTSEETSKGIQKDLMWETFTRCRRNSNNSSQ